MNVSKGVKVTVAMPAHNSAPYIGEAIDSVLKQHYDSFELVIVDDASTDSTFEVIRSFCKDSRLRAYHNDKNLGVGATRNKITRLAKGRYLSPCDSDDIMLAGNLERLSGFLDKHPQIGAAYGELLVVEPGTENWPYILGMDCNQSWDLLGNLVNHPGSMIRKSLIQDVGGYDETCYSADDWSLWLKLAERSKIRFLEGELYYIYRRRKRSLTATNGRMLSEHLRLWQEALKRRYGIILKD